MRKAVFLDRDGTIIEDRGHVRDRSQVVFLPGAFDALRRLQEDFLLLIVTNQSGVAVGDITPRDVDDINRYVVDKLAEQGIRIDAVYVCPHSRQDGCECIKPKPHFLHRAQARFGLDLQRSFTIGDHPHDVDLATPVGAGGIYVLTGHGKKHLAELSPEAAIAADIAEAADRILALSRSSGGSIDGDDRLARAADLLHRGGTVAFPTETVYGLGANALDAEAVAKIFEIKRRPRFNPLIAHVGSAGQAGQLVASWPEAAAQLARRFWPGPLTLVLPRAGCVPDIVTAGLETVALRMPAHPLALGLIRKAALPIAAPSANRFGTISPTTAEHVHEQLGDSVDMILDGGPCRVGIESTIVSLAGDRPTLLRAGGTPVEQIEEVLGLLRRHDENAARPASPGQCPRHYAPRTPLVLCDNGNPPPTAGRRGLLSLGSPDSPEAYEAVEVLSESGDLREAATRLFAAMHRLDMMGLDLIVARKVPDAGLGLAINDRLQRAAYRSTEPTARRDST